MTFLQWLRFILGMRPGTLWNHCHKAPDLGHTVDYGHLCCRYCGGDYQSHGADVQTAARLGIAVSERHLICGKKT